MCYASLLLVACRVGGCIVSLLYDVINFAFQQLVNVELGIIQDMWFLPVVD